MAPLAIVGMVLFAFIGGEVVKLLWNWLLPPLFGWRLLTFWQALGLLALCRILFGGLGGHRGPGPGFRRHRFRGCRNMTPEEREKFRKAMEEGYGFGSSAGEKATPSA
jgi:hypothetical protein